MQLSALLLSASLLFSSALAAPTLTPTYGSSSDAELMLKRQFESTNWDHVILGRDAASTEQWLEKRIVYNPHITSPNTNTVWTAGNTYDVTWDTSDLPSEASEYKGQIKLGYLPADGEGGENLHWQLASGFAIKDGKTQVTLPGDLKERDDYIVVVFGDSGNASEKFTIKAAGQKEEEGGDSLGEEIQEKINQAFAQAGF